MKIKFLGTSAGWPLPRLGCNCEICISPDPKDKRTRTQLLINDTILLDAGPDTYNHLLNHNPSAIRHLLISHAHPDHVMGLWGLPHVYGQEQKINLVVTPEVLNGIRQIPNFLLVQFKTIVIRARERFQLDGNTTCEYFPVEHGRRPAFGIKIKSGPILVYIPDFVRIGKSEKSLIKDVHLLVIDGSSLTGRGQVHSHQSIEQGIELAKELKAKKTYFVHLGHDTGSHRKLEEFVQTRGGKNFHIAYDNLELDL